MDRYADEVVYDRSNGVRTHKTLTIRVIDRSYDRETSNVHIVKNGETLFSIAELYYNDFKKWYIIADKNPTITNPFILESGMELIVPELDLDWSVTDDDDE